VFGALTALSAVGSSSLAIEVGAANLQTSAKHRASQTLQGR